MVGENDMSIVDQAPDMFLISIDKMDMSKVDAKTQSELDKIMTKARAFYPFNWIPVPIDPRITQCQIASSSVNITNRVRVINNEAKVTGLDKNYRLTITATDSVLPWLLTSLLEQVWELNDSVPRVRFFSPDLIIMNGVLVSYTRSNSEDANVNSITITIQETKDAETASWGDKYAQTCEITPVSVDTSRAPVSNKTIFH